MNLRKEIKKRLPSPLHFLLKKMGVAGHDPIEISQQALLQKICVDQIDANTYNYEPVQIGLRLFSGQRDWKTRWAAIKSELDSIGPGSILDVGCAEGWFIRRAAEDCGFFAIGIETRLDRILSGESARLHDAAENYGTIRASLSTTNIINLPKFDVVSCFSVVHHIVYNEGIEKGREFVEALGTRSQKLFLFEMGTSDEKQMEWASKMPAMPNGQDAFIREFLSSAGFTNIRSITNSSSFKNESERILFAARPPHVDLKPCD